MSFLGNFKALQIDNKNHGERPQGEEALNTCEKSLFNRALQ